ncbi:hypothetical protein [Microlunatus parietis]|uniref:Uncharacterized protein n=1 Tax=Microlunatus parietis TaxID=682979 RepID=A0A7Y9LB15_9ACTN|nr:hypothetical protein [Microlunatus parietis]NYE73409.1 hypothetical protein [Microlunatus parietis]
MKINLGARALSGALLALTLGVAALTGCAPGTDSGGGIPSAGPGSGTPSSSAGAPTSSAPGTSAPPTPDAYAYAACMREHGIDMADPDPKTGLPTVGDSVDPESAAFKEAHEACGDLLPGGIRGQGDDTELDAYLAFAQCMRKNGMPDFPDPQPGSGEGMFPGIDRNDPAFGKASEACQHLLAGSDQ